MRNDGHSPMENTSNFFFNQATRFWFTKRGLLSAVLFLILSSLILIIGGAQTAIVLIALGVSMVAVTMCWGRCQPIVKKGYLGLGVAIAHEYDQDSVKVHKDFVSALKRAFDDDNFTSDIQFVVIDPHKASEINTAKVAKEVCHEYNLTLLLYGETRQRREQGKDVYIVDFRLIARHAPTAPDQQSRFQQNVNQAAPSRIKFSAEDGFQHIETAAKHYEAIFKYVLGICCVFAGKYDRGVQMLEESYKEIARSLIEAQNPVYSLAKTIRSDLNALYEHLILGDIENFRKTRNISFLERAEPRIQRVKDLSKINDMAQISSAICHFAVRKDVAAAYLELRRCKNHGNSVWLYNMAFLKAYEGKLDEAYKLYQRAFRLPVLDKTVIAQCEEFIDREISEDPRKSHLYYCLGLINYHAKGDYEGATSDFTTFLKLTKAVAHQNARVAATRYLAEIERKKKRVVLKSNKRN